MLQLSRHCLNMHNADLLQTSVLALCMSYTKDVVDSWLICIDGAFLWLCIASKHAPKLQQNKTVRCLQGPLHPNDRGWHPHWPDNPSQGHFI